MTFFVIWLFLRRCLPVSSVCDGIADCTSGQDETNCEKEKFNVNNKLVSSRSIDDDVIIENTSQESCAKFCSETTEFQCVGFQHSLLSNECRLLDSKFSLHSVRASLRGFWITFEHDEGSNVAIPTSDTIPSFDNTKQVSNQDGFGDGLDAVVVEADFDLPDDETERAKRQVRFPSYLRAEIQDKATCGIRSVPFDPPKNNNRISRIINGVDAPLGAYPWQVAIKVKDGQSLRQWCGGSILTDRLILTAAHCIDHLRDSEFVVVVGDHDTGSNGANEQLFEVEKYVSHSGFKSSKGGNDIALVKLQTVNGKGIIFGDSVQSICLPSSDKVYQSGTWCSVSGWGMQKPGKEQSASKMLKVASIPLLDSESCNSKEVYGNELNSITFPHGMLCAGFLEGGTDSCSGDSGGPLACNVDGKFQLLGVVSWGEGCAAKNKPGVYTKVFHYLKWIEEWSRKL